MCVYMSQNYVLSFNPWKHEEYDSTRKKYIMYSKVWIEKKKKYVRLLSKSALHFISSPKPTHNSYQLNIYVSINIHVMCFINKITRKIRWQTAAACSWLVVGMSCVHLDVLKISPQATTHIQHTPSLKKFIYRKHTRDIFYRTTRYCQQVWHLYGFCRYINKNSRERSKTRTHPRIFRLPSA